MYSYKVIHVKKKNTNVNKYTTKTEILLNVENSLKYKDIVHQWDVWHGAKNLGKKLIAISLSTVYIRYNSNLFGNSNGVGKYCKTCNKVMKYICDYPLFTVSNNTYSF